MLRYAIVVPTSSVIAKTADSDLKHLISAMAPAG